MLHTIIVCTFTLSSQFQQGCHIIFYTFALSFYIRLCYNFIHCSVIILNTDVLCFGHSCAWFVYCRLIVLYIHVVWFCTLLFDHFVNCCLDTLFTLLYHHFGYHCFVHCWIIILCAVMLSCYCYHFVHCSVIMLLLWYIYPNGPIPMWVCRISAFKMRDRLTLWLNCITRPCQMICIWYHNERKHEADWFIHRFHPR